MPSKKDKWVRRTILAVGVFVLLFSILIPPTLRGWFKRDRQGAAQEQGVAAVVILVPPGERGMMNPAKADASALVRFHGSLYTVKTVDGFEKLKVGQPARIYYTRGRSGRIYVDRVAPLSSSSFTTTQNFQKN